MIVHVDSRSIATAFFRQQWKFFYILLAFGFIATIYAYSLPQQYESTAKLLIKFGSDARPEVSNQPSSFNDASESDHRELVQSNVSILTSRDLAAQLLREITIERVYPDLVKHPPTTGETLMDAAIRKFSGDLAISTQSEANIIDISIFNTDPDVAKDMLTRLLDLFIIKQTEIYANPQTTVLGEQAKDARAKLESAQKRLYEYKNRSGIVSMDEELTLLLKQRSDLNEELFNKERSFAHYQSAFVNHNGQDPDILAIKRQIGALEGRISETVRRKASYDDLTREIQLDEDNYKAAHTRMEEAEANQNLNQQKITRITVLEQPTLPYKPAKPMKRKILGIAMLIGLALAAAACLATETLDQSFSLPDQAALVLGIPVLASFRYQPRGYTPKPAKSSR